MAVVPPRKAFVFVAIHAITGPLILAPASERSDGVCAYSELWVTIVNPICAFINVFGRLDGSAGQQGGRGAGKRNRRAGVHKQDNDCGDQGPENGERAPKNDLPLSLCQEHCNSVLHYRGSFVCLISSPIRLHQPIASSPSCCPLPTAAARTAAASSAFYGIQPTLARQTRTEHLLLQESKATFQKSNEEKFTRVP